MIRLRRSPIATPRRERSAVGDGGSRSRLSDLLQENGREREGGEIKSHITVESRTHWPCFWCSCWRVVAQRGLASSSREIGSPPIPCRREVGGVPGKERAQQGDWNMRGARWLPLIGTSDETRRISGIGEGGHGRSVLVLTNGESEIERERESRDPSPRSREW